MDTFKKRQKEMRRLERQRDKFARRMERKLHKGDGAAQSEEPAPETPSTESETHPASDAEQARHA